MRLRRSARGLTDLAAVLLVGMASGPATGSPEAMKALQILEPRERACHQTSRFPRCTGRRSPSGH